ncbi:hypothetical protein SDC9_134047 [bioreactor metagenome]|uniref:Uncharacterized protein n=1 Tax=bioreactor metagenome TaxID=1076179 RepID=A0A645DC54_9ZZZZ
MAAELFFEDSAALQHRSQGAAAEFRIKLAEPFDIDVGGVDQAVEIPARLRIDVAVGHQHRAEAVFARRPGDFHAVFDENRRFVVGQRDGFAMGVERHPDDFLRRHFRQPSDGLHTVPRQKIILAELAAEIAAHRADGEGPGAGAIKSERFFFDRIDLKRRRTAIGFGDQFASDMAADTAESDLVRRNDASVRAEIALNVAAGQRMVIACFHASVPPCFTPRLCIRPHLRRKGCRQPIRRRHPAGFFPRSRAKDRTSRLETGSD